MTTKRKISEDEGKTMKERARQIINERERERERERMYLKLAEKNIKTHICT